MEAMEQTHNEIPDRIDLFLSFQVYELSNDFHISFRNILVSVANHEIAQSSEADTLRVQRICMQYGTKNNANGVKLWNLIFQNLISLLEVDPKLAPDYVASHEEDNDKNTNSNKRKLNDLTKSSEKERERDGFILLREQEMNKRKYELSNKRKEYFKQVWCCFMLCYVVLFCYWQLFICSFCFGQNSWQYN